MTEKQFRVQEHCIRSSYGIEAENWLVTNDNHCVVLNDKAEAHMVANMYNDIIDVLNALHEENEQLKKDATILIYSNQDYRQENENLKKQLDYIQNLISNSIEHQKTELGQKALQGIINDYNEWLLGHKRDLND